MTEIKQTLQGKVATKDLGGTDEHGKKYLGKTTKKATKNFTIQADPEFYDRHLGEIGLEQGVSSRTPGTKATKPTAECEKEPWDEDVDIDSHRHYRNFVGMLRWLVAERPDIMFDAKNVSENLQSPKYRHWQQLKRTVRYLADTRDYVQKIEVNSEVIADRSGEQHSSGGWSDTDFAGDVESRRSTSCAVLRMDGAVIHTHSRKQTLIATSTTEVEMCGIPSVTFEGFAIRSFSVIWDRLLSSRR